MTLVIALLIAGCLGFCSAAGAAQFKTDENGQLFVARWAGTGVFVAQEARKYLAEVGQAFLAPGKTISVQSLETTETKLVDLFHYREDIISPVGVKYDAKTAMVGTAAGNRIPGKPRFFWFPIYCLIAIGAIGLLKRCEENLVTFRALVFFVVSVSSIAFAGFAASEVPNTQAAIFSLLAAVCVAFLGLKGFSIGVCGSMIALVFLAAGLVYYPLFL